MPALPPVPNVIKADFFYTIGSDLRALNRLFIGYTGGIPSSADVATLAGDLYTIWAAEIAHYMCDVNVFTGCEVTDLSSALGHQATHAANTNGSLTSTPLPANVAGLGSMKIGRRYRGGKPRTYLPVGDQAQVLTPQTWQSTFVSNMQASLNATITDIAATAAGTTSLTNLVNVSYYSGFTVVTNPSTGRARNVPKLRTTPLVDPVLSWTFEVTQASQRRRLLRQP